MLSRALKVAYAMSILTLLGCATSSRYRPARVATKRALNYPLSAQLEKIEGEVAVGVFVNADGHPVTVRVLESSGHAVLDTAAYQFAQTLTFNPAIIDEERVSAWTKLVLQYRLTDVVFEKTKWTRDVLYLQKQIAEIEDDGEKVEFQRRLYIQYIGFVDYAKNLNRLDLNYTIKGIIQKSTMETWRDYWPEIIVVFALFDDFLNQYPDSQISEQAKQDFIRLLVEAESEIRTKALRSRKTAVKANDLIETIESRLKELQHILPQL
jgi:TonB family protein